jgi:hypothetical protein
MCHKNNARHGYIISDSKILDYYMYFVTHILKGQTQCRKLPHKWGLGKG